MNGFRYVVEKGGVSWEERGYIRSNTTQLLGEEPKTSHKWTDLRNATQFYTEEAARLSAEQSGLDGMKVVIKCYQYDEYCETYNKKQQVWENMGSV